MTPGASREEAGRWWGGAVAGLWRGGAGRGGASSPHLPRLGVEAAGRPLVAAVLCIEGGAGGSAGGGAHAYLPRGRVSRPGLSCGWSAAAPLKAGAVPQTGAAAAGGGWHLAEEGGV